MRLQRDNSKISVNTHKQTDLEITTAELDCKFCKQAGEELLLLPLNNTQPNRNANYANYRAPQLVSRLYSSSSSSSAWALNLWNSQRQTARRHDLVGMTGQIYHV